MSDLIAYSIAVAVRSEMSALTARRCSVKIVDVDSVAGPNVFERCRVSRLFRMVVDHQVDAREQTAVVVGLHVNGGDPIELRQRLRRHGLDTDIQQVGHPEVFRPRDTLECADDGGCLRAVQEVAQGEAAGHRIRVGIVVQQDEHAVRVGEEPLILLDPGACEGPPQRREERPLQQISKAQAGDLGKLALPIVGERRRGRLSTDST